jgi:hypothetical protein
MRISLAACRTLLLRYEEWRALQVQTVVKAVEYNVIALHSI